MPVTQGAGNADWNRDETLLALDLLYRFGAPIHKGHPDVVDLSSLLRGALIHPTEGRRPSFRNADGVALKLQNLFSAIDPTRGLSSSILDRELVEEFPRSRAMEVAALASMIREAIGQGEAAETLPDDEVFVEGHLLTSRHRSRDRRLRKKLLAQKSDDQLTCTICRFAAPPLERRLRESFFEAHHIRPLSETKGLTSTRVADMALVCAGCHRFIHRLIAIKRRWVSIDEAGDSLRVVG
ncbi:HNH endonuclease [Brevundimonas sp. DC300-4]|uniref:HNH endonuclease n=1 Tax=Brevundimonas sp. DC300-4 TaxID=2804594 RepID=UPI003CFB9AEB